MTTVTGHATDHVTTRDFGILTKERTRRCPSSHPGTLF